MSTRDDIIQGVRAWVFEVADLDPTDDTASVIPADDPGPRPPLPYVVVDVGSITSVGVAERREHVDGYVRRAQRTATVTLTACGDGAFDWLAELEVGERTALDDAGLALVSLGPLRTLPGVADTEIEPRAVIEVVLTYGVARSPVTVVGFDVLSIDVEYPKYDDDPGALTDTFEG